MNKWLSTLLVILGICSAFIPLLFHIKGTIAYSFPLLTGILWILSLLLVMNFTKKEKKEEFLDSYIEEYEKGIFEKFLITEDTENKFIKKIENFTAEVASQFNTMLNQARVLTEIKDFLETSVEKVISYSETTDKIALEMLKVSSEAADNVNVLYQALNDLKVAATEIANSIATTAQKTADTREKAIKTKEIIESLLSSSSKIGSVVEFISDIAEQTNLLALNAAIEAARAGEAGKGFAVVANEVKELAKQTSSATEEITSIIQKIQQETKNAVTAVESITAEVLEIDDLANTIASASEEQSVTISDITSNIEIVKNVVERTKSQADRLMEHVKEFNTLRLLLETSKLSLDTIALQNNISLAGIKVSSEFIENALKYVEPKTKLKIMLLKHYDWMNKVISGLIQGKPPEVEIEVNNCDVTHIINSFKKLEGSMPDLEELEKKHEKIHESVGEIQQYLAQGNLEAAINIFEEKTLPLFFEISNLFIKILRKYGAQVSEVTTEEEVFMPWSKDLEIGIKEIDDQHKRLVKLVNQLYVGISQGKDKEYLSKILNELIEYTDYHFKTEEYYFDKFGYPETDIHKEIHRKLVEKVVNFKKKFEEGSATLSYELLNFLKDWLINHIGKTDKKYGSFLKEKGLR